MTIIYEDKTMTPGQWLSAEARANREKEQDMNKPINNWTNGGLERALRDSTVSDGITTNYVTIPRHILDEVRRRLLGDHVPANPYVRIHTTYPGGDECPEFRGGKNDQCFDPQSEGCHETTSQELNASSLDLKSRDEHIERLKRELTRRMDLKDTRSRSLELARKLLNQAKHDLHRQNARVGEFRVVIDRQNGIIREQQVRCLADRNETIKATLREVYRRLVKGDWS